MSFSDNVPKLQPFKRSVSIIGVGATPFVRVMDDPECDGLTEGELFGYAARAAMKDAGITGKDVDFFVHGQAGPGWISNFGTANIHVANWLGMKGKASMHQSEACATGYVALEAAVSYVACDPDETFTLELRVEEDCDGSAVELESVINDLAPTVVYPIAPLTINGLSGHHVTYRNRRTQYYEAWFDMADDAAFSLIISTAGDILDIDAAAIVTAIDPRPEAE